MFGLPIERIEFSDVKAFCGSGVREGILLDFKRDFPGRLDKPIAAFANTYGGIVLLGVDEDKITGEPVLPICGLPLGPGLRERVVRIAIDSIYPPVIPEVRVVEFKSSETLPANDRAVVVIRVHESDIGSHAVDKRTTVYLRVDNVSDPYRKATVEEIEWFINKRQKAIEEKDRLIKLASEHARRYLISLRTRHGLPTSHPLGRFVSWTVPTFPRAPLAGPHDLMTKCNGVRFPRPYSRTLVFPSGLAHPITGGIYFDGDHKPGYEYTELQQQGLVYHERGFSWDAPGQEPYVWPHGIASVLDCALTYAKTFYQAFGYYGLVDLEFRLEGVRGRKLGSPGPIDRELGLTGAVDDVLAVRIRRSFHELQYDIREIAKAVLTDISWSFGIQADPESLIQQFSECRFAGQQS